MDDFILFVEGALGVPDFIIFVQVPHSRWSLVMARAMAHTGLGLLLGSKARRCVVSRHFDYPHSRHAHYHYSVQGAEGCPDFMCYVQLPKSKGSDEAALAIYEEGLASFLGVYAKSITVRKAGETLPEKGEELGEVRVN